MRFLGTLVAIALCTWFPFAAVSASHRHRAAEDSVELPVIAHAKGDVVRSNYRSKSTLHTVVLDDGKVRAEFDAVEERSGAKNVRVLATDARGPSRLVVEYGALEAVHQQSLAASVDPGSADQSEVNERNPLQGRTFVLQRERGGFRVLDENGARIAEGLARLVLEEESVDGEDFPFTGARIARELAGRPLELGVDIPLTPDAARDFVGVRGDGGELRFVVTPKEMRDEDGSRIAVFHARYSIRQTGTGGGPDTTIELSGEMQFDASSGWFRSLSLDGLLTLESTTTVESGTLAVTGKGPWSIRATSRCER